MVQIHFFEKLFVHKLFLAILAVFGLKMAVLQAKKGLFFDQNSNYLAN